MATNVLPWSYSTLTSFETCPRRYYLTKISKQVKEPQGEALIYGNEVHKALEKDLKGEQALPTKFASFAPLVNAIKALPGKRLVEQSFGLDVNLRPVSFFAKDCWVRGKIDLLVVGTTTAAAIDWKTGKMKSDLDQMKLFAAAALQDHPYLQSVRTGFAWLHDQKLQREDFKREDTPAIWGEFIVRVQRMENAAKTGDFPPNPSGLCRKWCPVGNQLCEFCGE